MFYCTSDLISNWILAVSIAKRYNLPWPAALVDGWLQFCVALKSSSQYFRRLHNTNEGNFRYISDVSDLWEFLHGFDRLTRRKWQRQWVGYIILVEMVSVFHGNDPLIVWKACNLAGLLISTAYPLSCHNRVNCLWRNTSDNGGEITSAQQGIVQVSWQKLSLTHDPIALISTVSPPYGHVCKL